jgi:hypothetical protein
MNKTLSDAILTDQAHASGMIMCRTEEDLKSLMKQEEGVELWEGLWVRLSRSLLKNAQ